MLPYSEAKEISEKSGDPNDLLDADGSTDSQKLFHRQDQSCSLLWATTPPKSY
jgi:hypothetical protein